MPVVLAVNGTIESYQPRSDGRRTKPRPQSQRKEDSSFEESGNALDASWAVQAMQQAYGQSGAEERKPAALAQDIMSRSVQTLRPETPLKDAWAFMKAKGFRHVPITSAVGLIVGIISDRDLLRVANVLEDRSHPSVPQQPVSIVMSTKVITATPATEIHELARVMLTERISALPIIDGQHHPIGIVTITDILRCVMMRAPLELWT